MPPAAETGGRAFLHSYDRQADQGFSVLELHPDSTGCRGKRSACNITDRQLHRCLGGGNKLIRNVVGVIEGNGGRLRPGSPMQIVHDGESAGT
ncbi:MAG: putative inorganic carbon transporter subunit DabA [Nitratireductor sp.]